MNRQRVTALLPGFVFLGAGVLKALDPASFAVDVYHYRLLPWPASAALALYLPWLEIVCGLALILRLYYRGALWIATLLMAAFLLAYGSTRWRGLDVACGCFGHQLHESAVFTLIFEALCLALLLWLLRSDLAGEPKADSWQGKPQ